MRVLGRSAHRRMVFDAILKGKKRTKAVQEIADSLGLERKQVLNAAKPLLSNGLVEQTKLEGDTAYTKDEFLSAHRRKIIRLVDNPPKLDDLPTKTRPKGPTTTVRVLQVPTKHVQTQVITLADLSQLSPAQEQAPVEAIELPEASFKKGFQTIIGERGVFKDWGGERNDRFTTNLIIGGARRAAAIAFKGPGTRGKLTPKKLGKNGDQIQRLFSTTAQVFIFRYWNEVDESVLEQMETFAVVRSVNTGQKIFYGIIDGTDSARILHAHPSAFPEWDPAS